MDVRNSSFVVASINYLIYRDSSISDAHHVWQKTYTVRYGSRKVGWPFLQPWIRSIRGWKEWSFVISRTSVRTVGRKLFLLSVFHSREYTDDHPISSVLLFLFLKMSTIIAFHRETSQLVPNRTLRLPLPPTFSFTHPRDHAKLRNLYLASHVVYYQLLYSVRYFKHIT